MSSGAARRRSRNPGRVLVHIDRVVVEGLGVSPAQRPTLSRAVETEMARLISIGGLPGLAAGSVPRAATSPIAIPASPSGSLVGGQVAGALHGFLGGRP